MKITAFEHRNEQLAPRSVYVKRQLFSLAIGLMLLAGFLFLGIAGYHWIAGLDWIDALLEASMILGGMGPINPPRTAEANAFASLYALFSGVIFSSLIGIILTPFAHRMRHKFQLDDK